MHKMKYQTAQNLFTALAACKIYSLNLVPAARRSVYRICFKLR